MKEFTSAPILVIFMVLVGGVLVRHLTYKPEVPPDSLPSINNDRYMEILKELDKAMDVVSMDGLAPGGFHEWFMPRINEAREAGASEVEINLRLNRVWLLALRGKYFDDFLRRLARDGHRTLEKHIQFLKIP